MRRRYDAQSIEQLKAELGIESDEQLRDIVGDVRVAGRMEVKMSDEDDVKFTVSEIADALTAKGRYGDPRIERVYAHRARHKGTPVVVFSAVMEVVEEATGRVAYGIATAVVQQPDMRPIPPAEAFQPVGIPMLDVEKAAVVAEWNGSSIINSIGDRPAPPREGVH